MADFARHLASEKRHSPRTCESYQRDLFRLATWLVEQNNTEW
ncbi:MAG TPA: tyrosine recombinase XerC, partial [Marinobacter sp.]|nr:tyrosine recombinase XerC [Marinobacter sp.]